MTKNNGEKVEGENGGNTNGSWVNSKIGLLIIGAIISGFLVPGFQYTQRFWEWRRQKQYESYIKDYENKKLLLEKTLKSSVYIAESQELLQDFLNIKDKKNIDRNQLIEKLNKIQTNRFNINTEIMYLIYTVEDEILENDYKIIRDKNQIYILKIKEIIVQLEKKTISASKFNELKNDMSDLKNEFDKIVVKIRKSIKDTENENKIFRIF